MRVYDYECVGCGRVEEKFISADRADDWMPCGCGELMFRKPAAPAGRVRGRADGNDRNDADQFTADIHGVRVKDLPPALKRDKK